MLKNTWMEIRLAKTAFLRLGLFAVLFFVAYQGLVAMDTNAGASAPAPFALQTKVLLVAGLVYTVLQGAKRFLPVTGYLAIAGNVALSVLGVVTIVQPQDLFSTQTLMAVITAASSAAGAHGTLRSLNS
ncbi:MAG: hypothetical protein LAP21_15170 [Acidobacteriia bacterium]|nr:hypothetical protein [Terriglobia bacterium]